MALGSSRDWWIVLTEVFVVGIGGLFSTEVFVVGIGGWFSLKYLW